MIDFGSYLAIAIVILILVVVFTIWLCMWAYRKKGVLGLVLVLCLGLIGALIVVFLPADKKPEREREREREFRCGICYIKYREELLGGETIQEGKICRFCLEKRQREK